MTPAEAATEHRRRGPSNAWWQYTATGLLGVTVSLVGIYALGGYEWIRRSEAKELFPDKAMVYQRLDSVEQDLDVLRSTASKLLEGQARVETKLDGVKETVDDLKSKRLGAVGP